MTPISDEEQRLNQRERCTLSQLQSGQCHLLQDYKHRVLGEPSDICTDRGASPQDLIHLFACTTHPTDLSPVDLWRNPVGSIRAFCYIDNETDRMHSKCDMINHYCKQVLGSIFVKMAPWTTSFVLSTLDFIRRQGQIGEMVIQNYCDYCMCGIETCSDYV